MADSEIQAGDTVILKSGGPVMTVEAVEKYSTGSVYATCTWFNDGNKSQDNFNVVALKKVDPKDYL